jgi:hypothetical protein
MVSTPTTLLGFEKQGQNDNPGAWWVNADQIFDVIDDAIAKEVAVTTTGGNTTLSINPYAADQSRCAIIRIGVGQTLISNALIITQRFRVYFVTNETAAGAFTVSFGGGVGVGQSVVIPRGCGTFIRVRSDLSAVYAGPNISLTTSQIDFSSIATGTFLVGANNLSDLANALTARSNLGVAIGSQVEAWSATLDAWAAIPTANKQNHTTNLDGWSGLNGTLSAVFEKDFNGNVMATGIMGDMPFDFACTILGATMLADQTGSAQVEIWKQTYGSYPPNSGNKISASAPLNIVSTNKYQDTTLTGWTTAISAGDVLRFNLNSVTSITRLTIGLKIKLF